MRPPKLFLSWSYQPRHAPQPAWPRDQRMSFDRAYHVVLAKGRLFFGSSADHKVYALDAATGEQEWTFFTEAPVRFAPTVWKDRVFVVSDDGFLYCLNAADGRLINRWRGGPKGDFVLGNGRFVSRWPARGRKSRGTRRDRMSEDQQPSCGEQGSCSHGARKQAIPGGRSHRGNHAERSISIA